MEGLLEHLHDFERGGEPDRDPFAPVAVAHGVPPPSFVPLHLPDPSSSPRTQGELVARAKQLLQAEGSLSTVRPRVRALSRTAQDIRRVVAELVALFEMGQADTPRTPPRARTVSARAPQNPRPLSARPKSASSRRVHLSPPREMQVHTPRVVQLVLANTDPAEELVRGRAPGRPNRTLVPALMMAESK